MVVQGQSLKNEPNRLLAGLVSVLLFVSVSGCGMTPADNGAGDSLALSMRQLTTDELTLTAPEDATVECDGAGNAAGLARWLGSVVVESTCGGAVVTNDFTGLVAACGATAAATVTWSASDDCGNALTHTATFTIADTMPPTIDGPDDVTVACEDADTAAALRRWLNDVAVSDDCSEVTLSSEALRLSDGCGDIGTTEATWVATDACGNVATHTATFTVTDTTPLLVLTVPDDLVLECDGEDHEVALNRWLAAATVSGGCGGAAVTHETARRPGACNGTFTIQATWTATDDCGAEVILSALFRVADSTPPSLAGPRPLDLECGDPAARSSINRWLASATAEDVCGDVTITDDFERLADACGLSGEATVTWTATDACGNTSEFVAEVRLVDTLAPTLTVPDDRHDFCTGGGSLDDLEAWVASAAAEDDCGEISIENDFTRDTVSDACGFVVTWSAADECGNTVAASAAATVLDDQPPVLTLNGAAAQTLECNLDTYVEEGAAVVDACDTHLLHADVGGDSVDVGEPGDYVVRYDARDICGNEAEFVIRSVTVVDTLPPFALDGIAAELWPPNHQYETLSLADCVRDLCEEDLDVDALGKILSIYSDEPENGTGDGNTVGDIVILSNSSFMVRVERRGGGDGRVYGVTFEISDSAGNTAVDTCLIGVPHDQSGQPPIDSGAGAGYTVEAP